uniref:Amidase domain-containing protein n=1 Tax=Meloidogyne javanica TaxID=6303 RepID=A0A915MCQ6_MELJA
MSVKLWIVLYTLREMLQFVDKHIKAENSKKEEKKSENEGEDLKKKFALDFAKTLLNDQPEYLMLWQSLNQSFKTVEFGSPPPAFIILCNALLGHRFVQTSKFCRTCSIPSAKKRCPKCKISSEQLITAYISRVRRVQPLINAIVAECFEKALEEAKNVDNYLANLDEQSEEYKNLEQSKPLLGVPFSNKNNMDVKGFVSVAGYAPFVNNPPAEKDCDVVERLCNAGAILIAITNLPKLAMNWSCTNKVYGRTRNPYDLRRIPGGSSGGEGALVGAGASPFGLGNDLGGSVRIPASMCGVFGLKPTKDAVSLNGFIPKIDTEMGKAQWTIGPLCRYAEDLPLVFSIISGKSQSETDFQKIDFSQVRIIYMDILNIWFMENVHSEVLQALRKSVRFFETEFNVTAQKVEFPLASHLYEIWGALGFGTPALSIPDILKEFPKMLKKLDKLRHQIKQALGDKGILLLPTWPTLAPFHHQDLFTSLNLAFTELFNILGFPAISCPVGLDSSKQIPLSVQIAGPPNSEPLLMAAAKEIERGFGGWVRP